MTCENCGHENPPDASYCAACGAAKPAREETPDPGHADSPQDGGASTETTSCENCGHQIQPQTAYCPSCGARTQRREPPPDLRQAGSPRDAPHSRHGAACWNCGSENLSEAVYCLSCGVSMAGPPDGERLTPARDADLQPRDLGGLFNEAFRIYTRNLWVFVLLAALPQIPIFLSNSNSIVAAVLFTLIGFALGLISGGASIFAVAQHYVDGRVDVGACLGHALQLAVILIISAVVVMIALIVSGLLIIVIIGIPLFFYFLVIWSFGSHAIIIEGTGPFTGLIRSRHLVRGSWWRVFGMGLAFVLVAIGIFLIILLSASILAGENPYVVNVISGVTSALVFPFVSIGVMLIYIDLRVRKEGYNLDTMASEIRRR